MTYVELLREVSHRHYHHTALNNLANLLEKLTPTNVAVLAKAALVDREPLPPLIEIMCQDVLVVLDSLVRGPSDAN